MTPGGAWAARPRQRERAGQAEDRDRGGLHPPGVRRARLAQKVVRRGAAQAQVRGHLVGHRQDRLPAGARRLRGRQFVPRWNGMLPHGYVFPHSSLRSSTDGAAGIINFFATIFPRTFCRGVF